MGNDNEGSDDGWWTSFESPEGHCRVWGLSDLKSRSFPTVLCEQGTRVNDHEFYVFRSRDAAREGTFSATYVARVVPGPIIKKTVSANGQFSSYLVRGMVRVGPVILLPCKETYYGKHYPDKSDDAISAMNAGSACREGYMSTIKDLHARFGFAPDHVPGMVHRACVFDQLAVARWLAHRYPESTGFARSLIGTKYEDYSPRVREWLESC